VQVTRISDPRYAEELQRVLASATLKNNPSLRRLLAYLAEASQSGSPDGLKEYSIGIEVMGKPAGYDPRTDSSVRVQIGKLRQKIDEYYSREAPDSPARLALPKGHFEVLLQEPEPVPEIAHSPARNPWKLAALATLTVAVVLAALLGYVLSRPSPGPALTAEQREFWGRFVSGSRPLLIVPGVPFFIRFGPVFFRNPYVNDMQSARAEIPLEALQKALGTDKEARESRRFTGMGEASALFEVARTLAPHRPDMLLKRSSVLAWEDLRTHSTVIVGPPKFAPQTRELPVVQEFVFDRSYILNLHPKPGEPASFHKSGAENPEIIPEEYALITYATGLSGWGDLVVLASTSTEGTWAAAEAVTSPHHLKPLLDRIRRSGEPLPGLWQAVIRARFQNQVPVHIEYVTHRILAERR
jgi:hypothetical protein